MAESTELQRCIRVTIEFIDMKMNRNPSNDLATTSNTLEDELKKLQEQANGN